MEKGKIGVQMMMLKEEIRRDGMRTAMEKLADLGYHAVEVSQIPMTPGTSVCRSESRNSDRFHVLRA